MSKLKKKSQIWYIDFIIGVTIFIVILIVAFKFLSLKYLEPEKEMSQIIREGEKISNYLMTPGIPFNWSQEQVVVIGIVSENNEINLTKLDQLKNMSKDDYTKVRFLFGIKSDFLLFFEDKDENIINLTDQEYIGKPGLTLQDVLDTKPEDMFTIIRYVIYRHDDIAEIVGMKVVIWKEK